MAEDNETRCWVSDQLINLFGFNNLAIVAFIIGFVKKTRVPRDLISQVEGFHFPASQDIETFACELQSRSPHKSIGLSADRKAVKEALVFIRKQ